MRYHFYLLASPNVVTLSTAPAFALDCHLPTTVWRPVFRAASHLLAAACRLTFSPLLAYLLTCSLS